MRINNTVLTTLAQNETGDGYETLSRTQCALALNHIDKNRAHWLITHGTVTCTTSHNLG